MKQPKPKSPKTARYPNPEGSTADEWQERQLSVTSDFAEHCAQLHDTNPFDQEALEAIAVFLATELWDRRFSQSEIKSAFETAVTRLVGYAAGEERWGDRR